MSPLQQLEPRPIWQQFDAIRQIPRPSKREDKIVAHVRAWAAEHGFDVRADTAGNLIVAVPATSGHEDAPTVVLQAHLDMVCEKNSGVEHDFDTEPIAVEVRGDWVHAIGTTLGADNGLGAAAAMAVAVDPEVVHGPLELLLTLDEETGLNGAQALDPSLVSGRLLLNLDTEEDDAVYIGCAGAGAVEAKLAVERRDATAGGALELSVRGLSGGHSGMDIHQNRGNAIKLLARLLARALAEGIDIGLVAFQGGSKANAIPREAFATLQLQPKDKGSFASLIHDLQGDFETEFAAIEPHMKIEMKTIETTAQPLSTASQEALIRLVDALPHGVITLSREVPGLVETSHNLAIVRLEGETVTLFSAMRSSVTAALRGLSERVRSLYQLAGAEARIIESYPGWKPNPESPLVRRGVEVYERLFDHAPEVKAVHAGLECGILVEKLDGLDAISIGPEICGAHSPDERACISSVAKFYRLLKAILKDIA